MEKNPATVGQWPPLFASAVVFAHIAPIRPPGVAEAPRRISSLLSAERAWVWATIRPSGKDGQWHRLNVHTMINSWFQRSRMDR